MTEKKTDELKTLAVIQPITSFEIPALDLPRAIKFYSALLGKEVVLKNMGGESGGVLSSDKGAIIGIIRCSPEYMKPSDQGVNIYLRFEEDLDGVIARVEKNGGRVVVPKMDGGEIGQFAWIIDSEGNRIGLNQPK